MFYYCIALFVLTFDNVSFHDVNVREQNYEEHVTLVMTRLGYVCCKALKRILQHRLMTLMTFCSKFAEVYVHQYLL